MDGIDSGRVHRRKRLVSALLGAGGLAALAAACSDSGVGSGERAGRARDALVATFAASSDVAVSDKDISAGMPNGTTYRNDTELPVHDLTTATVASPYEAEGLLKFNISLPSGAQVTSATLKLTWDTWVTGMSVNGYYLNQAWTAADVGWVKRTATQNWAAPGAKGAGSDYRTDAGPFVFSGFTATGPQQRQVALSAAVVQGWADNPATNHGVILVPQNLDKVLKLHSSRHATGANHPVLEVEYTTGGGSGGAGGGGSGGAGGGGSPPTGSWPGHPRLILTPGKITELRQRAGAAEPAWTALKAYCEARRGDPVHGFASKASTGASQIGPGGEGTGEEYLLPLFSLALCYHAAPGDASVTTEQREGWANTAVAVLGALGNPADPPNYVRDHGFDLRFFGQLIALGYDWMYERVQSNAALRSGLWTILSRGLRTWETSADPNMYFEEHPQGNYFAGYYAAKAYSGMAFITEEAGLPTADGTPTQHWNEFSTRYQNGGANSIGRYPGVASFYTTHLAGGGNWPEGWHYGPFAVWNMILPSVAMLTANQANVVTDTAHPFKYPVEMGRGIVYSTWPSQLWMEDRDVLRTSTSAQTVHEIFLIVASTLEAFGHADAPMVRRFAREVWSKRTTFKAPYGGPWIDFLFTSPASQEADYAALPLTHGQKNGYGATMRSSWQPDAVYAHFRAGPYVNSHHSTEQLLDAGALTIARGDMPFVVSTGFFVKAYKTLPSATWTAVEGDVWGGTRSLFNVFYNGGFGQRMPDLANEAPPTKISRFQAKAQHTYARATDLEDMYHSTAAVTRWQRDLVYLRPDVFVVYDRTQVSAVSGQALHWHLAGAPGTVASGANGERSTTVTSSVDGVLGRVTTVVPSGAALASTDAVLTNGNVPGKVYRLRVQPADALASQRWLTVFDADGAPGTVTRVSPSSAEIRGAQITDDGVTHAVIFGNVDAGLSIAGPFSFAVPAGARVTLADLVPSAQYSVSGAGTSTVTLTVGAPGSGALTASSEGVLRFSVASGGAVSVLND